MIDVAGERWIVANFDCESELAQAHPDSGEGQGSQYRLSARARRKVDALAPLLTYLGREDDRVVDASTWRRIALSEPTEDATAIGARRANGPANGPAYGELSAVLAWAETPSIGNLRHRLGVRSTNEETSSIPHLPFTARASSDPSATFARSASEGLPLRERLWLLPAAPAKVVAVANHRRFLLETAQALGTLLPGSTMIETLPALRRALATGLACSPRPESGWVLKIPFGSAGRGRVWIEPDRSLGVEVEARIERLLARHSCLLLEPWMNRIDDFGCCALVSEQGFRIESLHRQLVSPRGAFRGVVVESQPDHCADLDADEARRCLDIVEGVAERLASVGYSGPFGVDAWRYLDHRGKPAFQPLGEINARLTFGFVARAWRELKTESSELPLHGRATFALAQ